MDQPEGALDHLRWRRQFLLTRRAVDPPSHWGHLEVGAFQLYHHPDLDVAQGRLADREVVLLGYLFDAAKPARTSQDIVADLVSRASDWPGLVRALKPYAGRFVILYRDGAGLKIVQDALSLREVYYATGPNTAVCASQPGLLTKFSDPNLRRTEDRETLDFYDVEMRPVRNGRLWVGDGTLFDGVKHLLPNHYLDVERLAAYRYWPNEPWKPLEVSDAVDRACAFLQGMLKAVTSRYPVMMAVTAGTDSRTLLAASRDVRDKVYYFINSRPRLSGRSADIRIPARIFDRIGLPFHVHQIEQEVDPRFREIFLSNTFFAGDDLLPVVYNVYYRRHTGKVNLLGVGEIGRALWGSAPRNVTPYHLAYALGYTRSRFAVKACEAWLAEAGPVARVHGVDLMSLLLWEQLLGNWGAVGNSESDIAMEEFDPYDSHYMYETLLAVDDRSVGGDRNVVFRHMIRRMWPELLDFPINPPDNTRDAVKHLMKGLRLSGIPKRLRYEWHRRRFQWS